MTTTSRTTGPRTGDEMLGYAAIALAVTGGCLWTTTWIANGFTSPPGGLARFAQGLWTLTETPGDPATAFGATFPAPLWWTILTLHLTTAVCIPIALHRHHVGEVGTKRRRRLGVDTKARFATRRDLRALHVRGPVDGRFIFGKAHGLLLATEDRRHPGRDRKHQGDKACIAFFGPPRSGKTATVTAGILDWTGPAILSSVRGDLLQNTLEHRARIGEIRVWDPANVTNQSTCHWSPLRGATTVTGAMRAANGLAAAMPRDGASNTDFFSEFAKNLLWPLLWLAANTPDATMSDVVGWAMTQDAPTAANEGHVGHHLRQLLNSNNLDLIDGAARATAALSSIWKAPPNTAGSTYATIVTQLAVFSDPAVSAACDSPCNIDLDWLTNGANTLYLCAPLGEQQRLATPIMGLVRDLLDQAYDHEIQHGPLDNTLLTVLDEIGQTPVTWLPEVSATAAGTGILLATIWQSKAQLDARYRADADVILANHLTKIFFSGTNDNSATTYTTQLAGQEEIEATSHNLATTGTGAVQSAQQQARDVPLITADTLRRSPVGGGLLIHGNLPVAYVKGRRP